jgi:hypothetical protein
MKQEKREKRRKRTHFSKEQRRSTDHSVGEAKNRRCVKRRTWTLNRSPHGNKTAREQRGREQWKAQWIRERGQKDGSIRVQAKASWKVVRSGVAQTTRTEG